VWVGQRRVRYIADREASSHPCNFFFPKVVFDSLRWDRVLEIELLRTWFAITGNGLWGFDNFCSLMSKWHVVVLSCEGGS
jgi:hypothetical protein